LYYIYVLYSDKFDRFYVGLSSDIQRRLKNHNFGHVKSTKAYLPWRIVHFETFETRIEARNREKHLKSAAGRRWRKNNLGD